MPSLIPGFEYDIFISYRQNDNKYDGWVTEFVANLNKELEATIKNKVSVYFDANPHDGLLETHSVDRSLEEKLRCLIFIPILSRTYCDPNSYAWNNEFLTFLKIAREDSIGLNIKLGNGNVASRVLPIRIHDLNPEDISLVESQIGVIRAIDFVYKETGVNRPLRATEENPNDNHNKTHYRNQINKVANAIDEIISSLKMAQTSSEVGKSKYDHPAIKDLTEEQTKKAIEYNRVKSRKWMIIALSIFLSFVGVFAIYKVFISEKRTENISKQYKSIAVLPFANDSPDKDNEYFCNGMMEEILNQLQKISDLKVKSRTSVEKYRNPDKDIKLIGYELGVSMILEGSVRKIGDDLRITAQLIDANTGDHLWSEIYDGKYTTEIFEFQSNVAKKVATSLHIIITPQEEETMSEKPTKEIRAYDLILKANEMTRTWRFSKDSTLIKIALGLTDQALSIDPEYLFALSFKSLVYNTLRNFDSAWFYIKKIEQIEPGSYFIAQQKGMLYYYSNEPDSAYKYCIQTLESAPKNEFYKWNYLIMGQILYYFHNDVLGALTYFQKSYEDDGQFEPEINNQIAYLYYGISDYPKSLKYMNSALSQRTECDFVRLYAACLLNQREYDKTFHFLDSIQSITTCGIVCDILRAYTYANLKEYSKVEGFYKKAMNSGYKQTEDDEIYLGCIFNETGRKREALSILKKSIESDESALATNSYIELGSRIRRYRLAAAYAMIGDNKKALEYLSELEKLGLFEYPISLNTFPGFDNLSNDTEFKAIVKRIEDQKASLREQVKEMELRGEIDL